MKVHKVYKLFATAHTRAVWFKPAQAVEPKYPDITDGVLAVYCALGNVPAYL